MSDEKIEQELAQAEARGRSLQPGPQTRRGREHLEARAERARQAATKKQAISVRIDQDVIARLQQLAGPDGSYQTLLNRALIEWCNAQEAGSLLDERLARLEQIAEQLEQALHTEAQARARAGA